MDYITILIVTFLSAVLMLIPISVKWELKLNLVFTFTLIVTLASAIISFSIQESLSLSKPITFLVDLFLIAILSVSVLLWRFYRDPERRIPIEDGVVYSPADGKIVYVKRVKQGNIVLAEKKKSVYKLQEFTQTDLLSSSAYHIGIGMSFLDVHINRSPIAGKVKLIKHIKGSFKSLKYQKSIMENERAVMIIEGEKIKVGIVQIASRLVRMIVPFVANDQVVSVGERIGKIRFGSQVDLIIPQSQKLKILVKQNDYVKAGITPIAKMC